MSELPTLLKAHRFGREIRWHASIGSTNADAMSWALDDAPEGALVGTDHQTAGRGRHGRAWNDSPGHNLLFSIVLRPAFNPTLWGLIPLAAGLAVAEAIEQQTSLTSALKWPNDILLSNRKLCGVLLEGHVQANPNGVRRLVLGIGLNVNQVDFPAEVAHGATSLALELGRIVPRLPLLAELLLRLEERYESIEADGGLAVRAGFQTRMAGIGKSATVTIPVSGKLKTGIISGVAVSGALRFVTSRGEEQLHAGEVSFQHSPSFRG